MASACVFIAFAVLALSTSSTAADSRSIRFQHLSREQGLSQAFVYTIVQDRQGYLWFGTQEGLNRFDGYEFTVFAHDPDNAESISDETIRTMISDRSGALWIGTDAGGLSRFDAASQSFTNYLHDPADTRSISDNRVRVVIEDSSGILWIGTDGSGLDRFDPESERFDHYTHDPGDSNSLSGNHVWSMIEDADGMLWVATNSGLARLDKDGRSFETFRHDPEDPASISDDQLRVLYQDAEGNIWIGTASAGLNRFDRASGTFERFAHDPDDPSSLSADHVNTIFQDRAGVLWIGTMAGLNAWNPSSRGFEQYLNDAADPFSLSHNNVLSIFQDRGNVLWIGTYDGLSKWNQDARAMLHYRKDVNDALSLNENTVTSFAESPRGDIWVGTFGGGLNLLDRDTGHFRQVRHSPENPASLSSDRVMALLVDSDGVLWAGTRAAGLNRYDASRETFSHFSHDSEDPGSISADGITCLLEDRSGRLWIGTFGGGLNHFDGETREFTRFTNDPENPRSLSNDRVLVMFEDSSGSIWVGTYGGGLNRFDPATGEFTRFRGEPDRPHGLSGDEIYMIQEDAQGDLWIGVKGAGLNRWRRSNRENGIADFERYSEIDGLPSDTIYSGIWDQQGRLWLSTSRGLSRLDVATLEFRNYDTSHGLQGDEFNLAAGYRAGNGQLFFGGMNGFNAFQPEMLSVSGQAPQVAITQVLSLNEPIDLAAARTTGQGVRLDYKQKVIGFEFAALDFAAPDKSRYMYQLEGLDKDWVDAGTKRQVTYTYLPAGDYTFRVKALNNDGVWSEQDARIDLIMVPAPWRTWWAYLAYLIVLTAVVVMALRAHARRSRLTARLRYTDELDRLQQRLNEAQRIAGIGNWDWNTVTDELWWSDEIYRMFQMDRKSFGATYEAFLERVHPEDRKIVEQAVSRSLHSNEPYSIDHRIVFGDGIERIVHERAEVTFDDDGNPVRMIGTVHDITDRKLAEDKIRDYAEFQALLVNISSELIQAQPANIAAQLSDGLELVGNRYDLDAISIAWFAGQQDCMQPYHKWEREQYSRRQSHLGPADVPWLAAQLASGQPIVIDDVEKLPPSAMKDQMTLRQRGIRSLLDIPLIVDDHLEGSCVFSVIREQRAWSEKTITELKIIAEKLAGEIARLKAVGEIEELKDQLQAENLYLREEVRLAQGFDEIVGEDKSLRKCLQAVEKVAPTDATVLILGETGTGKELIARAIHRLSQRRKRPMVSINCPALPANLIESELFGHEKGAFTGAQNRRRGRFEMAEGGTLFLDEVGELPLELQSKLLRVLQTGDFERLGGTETLHADVRLIAATNRNLQLGIDKGEFRADLYYRISSFPIRLPPLRNRKDDIPLLAEHFVYKHADRLGKSIESISAQMIRELIAYEWPGNVRELESIIERSLISAESRSVLELPGPLRLIANMEQTVAGVSADEAADLSSVERSHIIDVLDQTNWKISGPGGAASVLGIPSSTLRSKMKRLGISRTTQ